MLDLRTDIGKNTLATRFHIDAHLIHRLVKGALEVKNKYPDAVMIFISPAKRETIEERLRGRSTESEEQLKIRTKSAIEEIKQEMKEAGALGAMMSGSGPTVFGLFKERSAARKAGERIRQAGLARQVYTTTIHNVRRNRRND